MKAAEIEERLQLLQREMTLAGEAVEELRRCLMRLHPNCTKHDDVLKAEVIR